MEGLQHLSGQVRLAPQNLFKRVPVWEHPPLAEADFTDPDAPTEVPNLFLQDLYTA